jgi:tripartite-type tricarboxylate transporter receptor subunit TctC
LAQKLNADINLALSSPKVGEFLMGEGVDVKPLSNQKFSQFIKAELKKWQDVVSKAHLNG